MRTAPRNAGDPGGRKVPDGDVEDEETDVLPGRWRACRALDWQGTYAAGLSASPSAHVPGPGITGGEYRGSR
jgi:hypothetical protein